MTYQISTENKNIDKIKAIVTNSFPGGYTIVEAKSVYHGNEANYLIIIIADTVHYTKNAVYTIAEEIKIANGQARVLVQEIPSVCHVV